MPERTLNFGPDAVGADYQIRDADPNLIIEHLDSGATFEYDESESAWIPTDPIGTDARPVPGVVSDSVSASELTITELSGHEYEEGTDSLHSNRALNSTYQNTTGHAIYWVLRVSSSASDTNVQVIMTVSQTSSGVDSGSNGMQSIVTTLGSGDISQRLAVLVPNGYYFRARAFQDTANYSIETWSEREWRA